MTIWTSQELLALIAAWKAAYLAASSSKSYGIDGRTLTRQDLPEIRKQLAYLEGELAVVNGSARRGPILVQGRVRR